MARSSHTSRYALPGVVVPAQLDYALRGLVSLALATEARTKVEVLASAHGLSRKFLAQVLVTLRNAGIVVTHRGSEGGYGLARPPEEIRMVEVFDALSPEVAAPSRVAAENGSRAAALTEVAWDRLAATVHGALSGLTLADLTGADARTRSDRTAGGLAFDASHSVRSLDPGGREELAAPRGA
jgi:Rrf2 family iron-sulfur cluster assembly transcriptional regulator